MSKHTTTECLLFPDLLDKPVVIKFDQEHASSDGGALLLKAADRRLGLIDSLSACLLDGRQEGKLTHSLTDLVAHRVSLPFIQSGVFDDWHSPFHLVRRFGGGDGTAQGESVGILISDH